MFMYCIKLKVYHSCMGVGSRLRFWTSAGPLASACQQGPRWSQGDLGGQWCHFLNGDIGVKKRLVRDRQTDRQRRQRKRERERETERCVKSGFLGWKKPIWDREREREYLEMVTGEDFGPTTLGFLHFFL